jgi:tRNA1(Val) A37 N6-methylase TrmN6
VSPAVTHDTLFGGAVSLWQPARGYRTNVDALLLGAFAANRQSRTVADLGAGVGAVSLTLGHLGASQRFVLVEREPDLAELARRNLGAAGFASSLYELDLGDDPLPPALRACADLVVSNPPYHEAASSQPRRDRLERRARTGTLPPFLRAARKLLAGQRARAVFAYPASSLALLLALAAKETLVPKRLRLVHPKADEPARLALVELRVARPGGLVVEPPLVEWVKPGLRTDELAALIDGRAGDRR